MLLLRRRPFLVEARMLDRFSPSTSRHRYYLARRAAAFIVTLLTSIPSLPSFCLLGRLSVLRRSAAICRRKPIVVV